MKKDLVLLPGLTNTYEVWDNVLKELPATIKGHSFDIPAQPTLEKIVDELLLILPNKFYLCGFSFGGYVALEILKREPNRVLGLIMIGSTIRADSEKQKAARLKTIERVEKGDYFQMIEENLKWLFHPDSLENKQLMNRHIKISKEYTTSQYTNHLQATMNRTNYTDLLKNSSVKKLFIAGESDQIMPPHVLEKQTGEISDVTFMTLANTGHMMPLEQPAAIANIIEDWIGQ